MSPEAMHKKKNKKKWISADRRKRNNNNNNNIFVGSVKTYRTCAARRINIKRVDTHTHDRGFHCRVPTVVSARRWHPDIGLRHRHTTTKIIQSKYNNHQTKNNNGVRVVTSYDDECTKRRRVSRIRPRARAYGVPESLRGRPVLPSTPRTCAAAESVEEYSLCNTVFFFSRIPVEFMTRDKKAVFSLVFFFF